MIDHISGPLETKQCDQHGITKEELNYQQEIFTNTAAGMDQIQELLGSLFKLTLSEKGFSFEAASLQSPQCQTSEDNLVRSILEGTKEYSIIVLDIEGQILSWNAGAQRTFGFSADEMVGKQNNTVLHLVEDIQSGKVRDALATALKTGKFEGEFQMVRKNGESFTTQVTISLSRDTKGNPIGYVRISNEINDQELQLWHMNESLEEQNRRVKEFNRLKSEYLSNLSNELRTQLNVIIGFSELIYEMKVGPVSPEIKEYLGDILTSARHLNQLINDGFNNRSVDGTSKTVMDEGCTEDMEEESDA